MKRILLILAFVILPITTASAVNKSENKSNFKEQVTQAIVNHDSPAFRSLYCKESESRDPALFSRTDGSQFTEVHIDLPNENLFNDIAYDHILSICFLPPHTKEMCEVYPIRNNGTVLCIVSTTKDEKSR